MCQTGIRSTEKEKADGSRGEGRGRGGRGEGMLESVFIFNWAIRKGLAKNLLFEQIQTVDGAVGAAERHAEPLSCA